MKPSQQEGYILDGISETGIYVIRKDNHQILYFNNRVKEVRPHIELGQVCDEVFEGSCINCPLQSMGERTSHTSVSYNDPFGEVVDITANEMLWNGDIPAYIITVGPHTMSREEEHIELERRQLYLALAQVYPMSVSLNLTQNTFSIIEFDSVASARTPCAGKIDELIETKRELIHPDFWQDYLNCLSREGLQRAFIEEERNEVYFEGRRLGDNGEYHWFATHVLRVNNPYNDDILAISLSRFIDDQKAGEERLRHALDESYTTNLRQEAQIERQQYFLSLIASDLDGGNLIAYAADEWPIAFASDSLITMLGYTRQEFEEATQGLFGHIILEEDYQTCMEEYHRQIADGQDFELEYRVCKRDGDSIWLMERGRRIEDENKAPLNISLLVDITKKKRQEDRLLTRMRTDPLTRLNTREYARERIEAYFARRGEDHASALLVMDLDNFKQINDRYGHMRGDDVLSIFGSLLAETFRSSDVVARLSGDEFLAFMKEIPTLSAVEDKAEEICRRIAAVFEHSHGEYPVTVSLGAVWARDRTCSYDEMFQAADAALYRAKFAGKNTWYVWNMEEGELCRPDVSEHPVPAADAKLADLARENIVLRRQRMDDERYRIIAEQSHTIVIEVNHATQRYYMSPGVKEFVWGCKRPVFVDNWKNGHAQGVHPEDIPALNNFYTNVENGANGAEVTLRLQRVDGEYVWCRVVLTVVQRFDNGSIKRAISTIQDVNDRIRAIEMLRYRAEHDLVTGYGNFERFKQDAVRLLENRGTAKYSLWYCDLKNFKYVNDIYGYETGDRLLKFWANYIASGLRPDEAFGRVSADNFVSLRIYRDRREITQRFEAASKAIGDFEELASKRFRVEMVTGVYCVESEEDMMSIEEMLDRANMAQKSVKPLGGSNCAFYSEEMRSRVIREKEMEAQMRQALSNGEFLVYFQPLMDIQQCNRVTGAELLVRWRRGGGELMSPGEFIPMFERNGFITELDGYVFEQACRYAADRSQRGLAPLRLSVNVSRVTMLQPDFVTAYAALKRQYGIPNGLIELESTETTFVENYQQLAKVIGQLREEGFLCAMDDFGTGYSSLNLLKDLPMDVLKLDMNFFRPSGNTGREYTIVQSVVGMAKGLEMRTVAEGVESPEQVEFLRGVGCDTVQGYVFAKPMPQKDFERYAALHP